MAVMANCRCCAVICASISEGHANVSVYDTENLISYPHFTVPVPVDCASKELSSAWLESLVDGVVLDADTGSCVYSARAEE